MKIAIASVEVMDQKIDHNVSVMRQTIEKCREKADFVVFGESALQGFNSLVCGGSFYWRGNLF